MPEDAQFDPTFDAYGALGLSSRASDDELRKAYRAIARKDHPDRNKGDSEAADRYAAAVRAWKYLDTPAHRKAYDDAHSTPLKRAVDRVRQSPEVDAATRDLMDRVGRVVKSAGGGKTPPPKPQTTARPDFDAVMRDADRIRQQSPQTPGRTTRPTTPRPTSSTTSPVNTGPGGATEASRDAIGATPLHKAYERAKPLISMAMSGGMRDSDVIKLANNVTYTFQRITYRPADDMTSEYRTGTPVLVRNDEAIAPVAMVTSPGLSIASPTTCRAFGREEAALSRAVSVLCEQRTQASHFAAELRSIMADDETITFNGVTIRTRTLPWIVDGTRVNLTVLCANDMILEIRDGSPRDPAIRFADERLLNILSENYLQLRGLAAAQARDNGRRVPAVTQQRVVNTFNAVRGRVIG